MILRKIIEIVAKICKILRLKCIKFDFGWGSAPDPVGGAYSAPPNPLAGFRGPTSKGRDGIGEGKGGGEREREEGEEGGGREGKRGGKGRGGGLSPNLTKNLGG